MTLLSTVLGRMLPRSSGRAWTRLVVPAALGAWAALLISLTVHLAWGHTPGGPSALSPVAFLGGHPSFVAAALLPALALRARPRSGRG